jgi:hypothetical protein
VLNEYPWSVFFFSFLLTFDVGKMFSILLFYSIVWLGWMWLNGHRLCVRERGTERGGRKGWKGWRLWFD